MMSIIKSCMSWSWNTDCSSDYLNIIIEAFSLRKILLQNRVFWFFLHFYFSNLKWKSSLTSKKYKHVYTKKVKYLCYLFTIYPQCSCYLIFGSVVISKSNGDSVITQLVWPEAIVHWAKAGIQGEIAWMIQLGLY